MPSGGVSDFCKSFYFNVLVPVYFYQSFHVRCSPIVIELWKCPVFCVVIIM